MSCHLLAVVGLLLGLCVSAGAVERPNVIVIVTDDQGYGDISSQGHPWLKTPQLDRLCEESVRLEDYHVDPYCTPTRAALMTGRYCTRNGAWAVTSGRQMLYPNETTMAEVFRDSGYRTGMFGKWHLGDTWPYAPRFRGFEDVVCHRAGGVDEIGNPEGNNYFDDTYFCNGKAERFQGYCTDVFFDETLRFIREEDERPFFVYLPLNAMHSPFTVAERYWKRFAELGMKRDRANFLGMIENFDENLGRLMAELAERKLDEKTLVIFMSDNGTAVGHKATPDDRFGFNAGMRGNKGSVYEGGHRVPCFVRWKGQLKAGSAIDELTCHRDWLPTLIDMCGLKAPEKVAFDGKSIVPLLKGGSDWPERTFFIERQRDYLKKGRLEGPSIPFAILTERWRMVNGELYEISVDSEQKRNVADKHPKVVRELYQAYEAYFADVSSHDSAYTRFMLGTDEENPITFTVRDWHPTVGNVIWSKPQLSDDKLYINGYWAVEVMEGGRYEFRVSRHPRDHEKPMGAKEVRLEIGAEKLIKEVKPTDVSVSFECELAAGPAILTTWLKDDGGERGAYHVEVKRVAP
ncbi:MAG: arylsulfatase [Verrucomicrobiota bacterium]